MPTVTLTAFDSLVATAPSGGAGWIAAASGWGSSPNGDSGSHDAPTGNLLEVAGFLTDDGTTVPLGATDINVSVAFDWVLECEGTLTLQVNPDVAAVASDPGASGSSLVDWGPWSRADLFTTLTWGWALNADDPASSTNNGRVVISNFGVVVSYTGAPPPNAPSITLNELDPRIREGLTIHDVLNDAPNTCSLSVEMATSPLGQAIRISSSPVPVLLFTGTIQTTSVTYDLKADQVRWDCTATDDLPRFNRRLPFGSWTEVSATIVGQELLAFAPGFTGLHIQDGLPEVSLSCTGGTTLSAAFAEIASLIGGVFKIEDSDVYLFISGASTAVEEITDLFTGDGVETVFTLSETLVGHRGYVTVDDLAPIDETLAEGGGGMWELDRIAGTITRYAPPADLSTITIIYAAATVGAGPEDAPDDIDDTPGRFLDEPHITMEVTTSQIRTRVYVQGAGPSSGGLEDPLIDKPTLFAVGMTAEVGGGILSGTSVWYGLSFVTAGGETIPRTAGSGAVLVESPDGSVELTDLDTTIHPDPRVTGRRLWRAQDSQPSLRLVTTLGNTPGIEDTYLDTAATASLTTKAPAVDTTAFVFVQVDDTAAQTALAALEGGDSDGVVEYFLSDPSLLTNAAATARGEAELALFAYPLVTVTYATRDTKTKSGKTVHIDVTTPPIGPIDLLIQDVAISHLGLSGGPIFLVTASSVRFSLEAILRMALKAAA